MAWIRREWSPEAAEEWTKEDLIACILSPLAYLLLSVGAALAFLLQATGFLLLGLAIVVILALHAVIDPKLRTISEEYEGKQRQYLEEIEKIQRWEEEV
ncbi:MAG: hypothetical protein ACE5IP_01100 [Terriglobia bacterium]